MKNVSIYFALLFALLGCSTVRYEELSDVNNPFDYSYSLADGRMLLELKVTPFGSMYVLKESKDSPILSKAESAIEAEDINDRGVFRGRRDVVSSHDYSKIVVREDVSDATPAVRFIFFQRDRLGFYSSYYLIPPVHRWGREPIAFEFPYIGGIEGDRATLLYRKSKVAKKVNLSSLEKFDSPTTAR